MAWLCGSAIALTPSLVRAAELRWRAPAECDRGTEATSQIEKLIGEPLAEVEGIAFDVEVSVRDDGAHVVALRTLTSDGMARTREIEGASCEEVAEAAAVAIALSISERNRAAAEPMPAEPATPAPEASLPVVSEPRWQAGLGLGVVSERGAMPEVGFGALLEGALEHGLLRLGLLIGMLPGQDFELAGRDEGGTFALALAAGQACVHPVFGRIHLLGCGGFEVSRLSAEGRGVSEPLDGDAVLVAPRAEVGVGIAPATAIRVWLRARAAMPLTRPAFLLDDTLEVHRPESVSFAGSLSAEIVL